MDKDFFVKKEMREAKEEGIFSEFAKVNPKKCEEELPEPEEYIVENFTLEYEAQKNSFIRWFKQTQPSHEDYLFKIAISVIKKDK